MNGKRGIELKEIVYNDKNKKKAEMAFGKGGSQTFLNVMIGILIAFIILWPIAIMMTWYILSGDLFESGLAIVFGGLIPILFSLLLYGIYRNYYFEFKKRDLIIFEDRIQLSHPKLTLMKDDIEEIIINTSDFDNNKSVIRERIKKKFFSIAYRLMITGTKDFKKHFIRYNGVIILHKRKEDRLGIHLMDKRSHMDLDAIKAALLEFTGQEFQKPRELKKVGKKQDLPEIVTVRTKFDSKNHNKVLLKVLGALIFFVTMMIISWKLMMITSWDLQFLMFAPIFSGFGALFAFAFLMGGLTQKLFGVGTGTYTIDGVYIEAQIASSLGYKIPLKAVRSVEKWPDENNGHFFKILKNDRSAAHLPAHNVKNTFIVRTSKEVWPITTLGGARPYMTFFFGDDDVRSGYNYIKRYLERRNLEGRNLQKTVERKKKQIIEKRDDIVRIRFFDKRSISRNFSSMYALLFAYLILVGFYFFFMGVCIYALIQGNFKALLVFPMFIIYHIMMTIARVLLASSFSFQIPYKKFKKEKLVIGKKMITIPWYDGLFGNKKVKLDRSSTEIIDFGYQKISDEDLKRFKKLKDMRWTLLYWPFNRRILGKVQHPFDRDLLFINDNKAYFFPADMLEEDYQRKLDGIIEYGEDIYDE